MAQEHGAEPVLVVPLDATDEDVEHDGVLNQVVWGLWPVIAWLLPVFLFLTRMATDSDGWEALLLLLASPVVLPVIALAGLLPRFILRRERRGRVSAGTFVTTLMLLHWWGMALFALAQRGTGDSGSLSSSLQSWQSWLPPGLNSALSVAGMTIMIAAWLGAAALAARGFARGRSGRAWTPWAALLAPPLLLAAILCAAYIIHLFGERDASGNTEADVVWMSVDDAVTRKEAHWDAAQEHLAPLREAITPVGWIAQAGWYDGVTYGDTLDSYRDRGEYAMLVVWRVDIPVSPTDAASTLERALPETGWTVLVRPENVADSGAEFRADGEHGYDLLVSLNSSSAADSEQAGTATAERSTTVTLTMRSPDYWTEGQGLLEWSDLATAEQVDEVWGEVPRRFSFDDWPALRAVAAKPW
ncbi:hypothetical protein [Microbacterium marinilacus]|uniref:Uncharacterized protein n=1 Tax=Microbacterium marinilacus TaxID=415209 RepID=A0ABP7BJI4_9MICO|nr:hypothetical protein [Microbacterium marinilacus]MBY0688316.1 hypothetical protein [Microbacterium marinilacus]